MGATGLGVAGSSNVPKRPSIGEGWGLVDKHPSLLAILRRVPTLPLSPSSCSCISFPPSSVSLAPSSAGVSWGPSQINYLHPNPCLGLHFDGKPQKQVVTMPEVVIALNPHKWSEDHTPPPSLPLLRLVSEGMTEINSRTKATEKKQVRPHALGGIIIFPQ